MRTPPDRERTRGRKSRVRRNRGSRQEGVAVEASSTEAVEAIPVTAPTVPSQRRAEPHRGHPAPAHVRRTAPTRRAWRHRSPAWAPVLGSAGLPAGVAVSVLVAAFLHLSVAFTAAVLLTGVVVAHHDADGFLRPHLRTPARLLRDVAFAFALVSCVLALRGAPMRTDREALLLIVAGVGTEAVVTVLRGRFGRPLRCLVVADPHTISSIAGRWATVGGARVIGGLVVDRTGL